MLTQATCILLTTCVQSCPLAPLATSKHISWWQRGCLLVIPILLPARLPCIQLVRSVRCLQSHPQVSLHHGAGEPKELRLILTLMRRGNSLLLSGVWDLSSPSPNHRLQPVSTWMSSDFWVVTGLGRSWRSSGTDLLPASLLARCLLSSSSLMPPHI